MKNVRFNNSVFLGLYLLAAVIFMILRPSKEQTDGEAKDN